MRISNSASRAATVSLFEAVGLRDRQRPFAVPVAVETARDLARHGAECQHIEIGKQRLARPAKILVAEIAAADDRADVIRNPRLVVHAAIQPLTIGDELEQPRRCETAAGKRIEDAHFNAGNGSQQRQIELLP